ncbi:MAG: gliding motility-associated C-terminal domain-containing protein [Bacteroidetes bacterium]|nr:gliding motility-associated C-terminal domain-containing protein [Bacteroidota bacterium]
MQRVKYLYRSILFLLLIIAFRGQARAQIVYVGMFNGDVYAVDPNTCNTQFIGNSGLILFDIATCGGLLYGTDGTNLYSIDPFTGASSFVSAMPVSLNSLVCDGNGVLYAAGTDLYSYNTATGVWTFQGMVPMQSAGDLAFYNGNLYLSDINNNLIQINLTPFSTQISCFIPNFQFWGMGSVPGASCNDPEILIGGDFSSLYTINATTGATSLLCNLNLPVTPIVGLATEIVPVNNNGFTLTSLTASPLCNGDLTGSATVNVQGGAAPFTYLWPASGNTTNSIANVSAGTYDCIVTDSAGCIDTLTVIITQPSPLIAAINAPAGGCSGTQAQLNGNAAGGTGLINYLWLPGAVAGNTLTVTPQQTTTYTLVATDANGCTDSAQSSFAVWPVPVAALNVAQTSVCEGSTVAFTSTSTIQAPGVIAQWNWDFGNGNTATGANVTPTFNQPGAVNVSLIVISADGCSDTVTQNAVVTVNMLPVADFNYQLTASSGFNGQVQFNDLSTGATNWFWQFGDPASSTSVQQNPNFTYPDPDCYTIQLVVSDAAGCTDSTTEEICFVLETTLYIPNTFTPGGDGKNEIFIPVGENISTENYLFRIYNRWGEMLFETTSPATGWDGTYKGSKVQIDTYVWTLQYADASNRTRQAVGHVNVIR